MQASFLYFQYTIESPIITSISPPKARWIYLGFLLMLRDILRLDHLEQYSAEFLEYFYDISSQSALSWPLSHPSLMPCLHHIHKGTSLLWPDGTERCCCDVTAVNSMCVYVVIYSAGTKLLPPFGERKYKHLASKGGSQTPACMCNLTDAWCKDAHTNRI